MKSFKKIKIQRCNDYLLWLRDQPCWITGDIASEKYDIVPAHKNLGYGGTALKSHDMWALPEREDIHRVCEHHKGNFWVVYAYHKQCEIPQ